MPTLAEFCPGATVPTEITAASSIDDLARAAGELTVANSERVVLAGAGMLQQIVTGAITAALPTGGGALAGVINFFWKQDNNLWGLLEAHVENLVRKVVAEKKLDDLTSRLNGYSDAIMSYAATQDPVTRWTNVNSLVTSFQIEAPTFVDSKNPELMLPYIATFGSFYLALLRDKAAMRRASHGEADADARRYAAEFGTAIDRFRAGAIRAYRAALRHRRDQITVSSKTGRQYTSGKQYEWTEWIAGDTHDDWRESWIEGDKPSSTTHRDAEQRARDAQGRKTAEAIAALEPKLRPFLTLSEQWPRLAGRPAAFPVKYLREQTTVAGVDRPNTLFVDLPRTLKDGTSRLRRLSMWGYTRLVGLAAEFDSAGGRVEYEPFGPRPETSERERAALASMNKPFGNVELVLEADEDVTALCVHHDDVGITALSVLTNRGRTAGVRGRPRGAERSTLLVAPAQAGETGVISWLRLKIADRTHKDMAARQEVAALELTWAVTGPARRSEDLLHALRMARLPAGPAALARLDRSQWTQFLDRFGAERDAVAAANAVASALAVQGPAGGEAVGWVQRNREAIYRAAIPRRVWDEFISRFQSIANPDTAANQSSYILQLHGIPKNGDGSPNYNSPEAAEVWGWIQGYKYSLATAER